MTDEALRVLQDLALRGALTPEEVVASAREEASPLHEFFEWDDARAAHGHRLTQARELIRAVRVEVTVEERVLSVPKYVHDPRRSDEGGYVETLRVADDKALAERVLKQELARALGCLERAKRMAAVFGMRERVEAVLVDLTAVAADLDVEVSGAA